MTHWLKFLAPVFFALSGLLLCTSGCSHYQLGTGGRLEFQTLYVEPVVNQTRLPQAVGLVSTELREALLKDGRIRLVATPAGADATLSVTLLDYEREVATARADDTGLARKFDLQLSAACTLRNNRSGTVLFEKRTVTARQQIFATASPSQTDSNQLQAEYQSVPLLARTLADRISHATLDVW